MHYSGKPGLPSRFSTTTIPANEQSVEAETGWLYRLSTVRKLSRF